MRKILLKLSENVVFWLTVVLMGFLTVVSLISTTYFKAENINSEIPLIRMDNVLLNILVVPVFALIILSCCGIKPLEKIKSERAALAAALITVILSIIWINISGYYPDADQASVSRVAYLASTGDFKQFEAGNYMQVYPNQLGMVAILEVIYRVTGSENWTAFQYINAVANGFTVYLLYRITHRLFKNRRTDFAVIMLSVICAPLLLYSTYVYGITTGLALALAAFYFLLVYFENEKLRYALFSGLAIGAAVIIKNNYGIFLVGMIILSVYKTLEKKTLKALIPAITTVILSIIMSSALTAVYEVKSGEEIGNGMPKLLWVAMGMQEGERAEGWYNGFNYDTFTEYGEEEALEKAKEAIAERAAEFAEDPLYALQFYYKKTVTQWNEPTYEAIWANRNHIGEFSVIVQSLYDGKLYIVMQEYMNIYQQTVFAAVLAWCIFCIRQRKTAGGKSFGMGLERLFLSMIVIGGFIFHLIWEAKSGYILPYFICMLPTAAAGLTEADRAAKTKFRAAREKKPAKNAEGRE